MYTVAKLAGLLGLGTDAVRYYTERGLLQPWVDPENGYRYFTEADVVKVLYARVCRSFGLSVSETMDFGGSSAAEQMALLEARGEEMDRQIRELCLMRERISEVHAFLKQSELCDGRVVPVTRESIHSLYTVGARRDYSAQRALMGQWVEKLPYTHISIKVPLEELSDPAFLGRYSVETGIGVVHKYLKPLGLSDAPPVESIPGGEHLIIYLKCKDVFSLSPKELAPLHAYVREHGLRFLNNTSGRMLAAEPDGADTLYSIMLRVRVGPR